MTDIKVIYRSRSVTVPPLRSINIVEHRQHLTRRNRALLDKAYLMGVLAALAAIEDSKGARLEASLLEAGRTYE